jgi:tetratricopeptide (TPR) repeat protein
MGFIVLFFSFLAPFIEGSGGGAALTKNDMPKQSTKIISLAFLAVLFVLCCTITFKQMNTFNGGIKFWSAIREQAKRHDFTADKFYAWALMSDRQPAQAVNVLLPAAQALNFSYDEIDYALGTSFILAGQYDNAVKVFEMMLETGQMANAPQIYASIVLSYAKLDNEKQVNFWLDKMAKNFSTSINEAAGYASQYAGYLNRTYGFR